MYNFKLKWEFSLWSLERQARRLDLLREKLMQRVEELGADRAPAAPARAGAPSAEHPSEPAPAPVRQATRSGCDLLNGGGIDGGASPVTKSSKPMIVPKSSDLLTTGVCPQTRLRFAFAEVTDSARALEQNHLCGPTAGLALAEALAGAALLGADLHAPDETVLMRLQVPGPIRGFLAEAAGDGGLRGYTQVKVMNALDDRDEIDLDEAFGDRGDVQILQRRRGGSSSMRHSASLPSRRAPPWRSTTSARCSAPPPCRSRR